jgi:hypothetical protein
MRILTCPLKARFVEPEEKIIIIERVGKDSFVVRDTHATINVLEMVFSMGTMNSEVLLLAVCTSPGHAWSDADIIKFLSYRHKSPVVGDVNAEHPFWNSVFSNSSGEKQLD